MRANVYTIGFVLKDVNRKLGRKGFSKNIWKIQTNFYKQNIPGFV